MGDWYLRSIFRLPVAGVDSSLWEMTGIVEVIDDWERDNAGQ
jgi:hypothetical protein